MSKLTSFFKKHRKATIIVVVTVVVLSAAGGFFASTKSKANSAVKVETNVTILAEKNLDQIITTKGTIQSTEKNTVYTALTAKVSEIAVKVGDVVANGDFLAQLDTRDYQKSITELQDNIGTATKQQKSLINQAAKRVTDAADQKTIDQQQKQKAIDDAAADLEQAKEDADNAANDSAEAAADAAVLAHPDVVNAKSVLTAAQTAMNSAKAAIAGDASPNTATYDAAVLDYNAALTAYDSAYSRIDAAIWEDERDDAYDNYYKTTGIDAAQAVYDAAVTAYNNFARSNDLAIQEKSYSLSNQKLQDSTASLESQLKSNQLNIEDARITAPVSGTITEVIAALGARPSGPLFVIQDTSSLEISTTVAEYDIPKIHEGQAVNFTTEATESDELTGTVDSISPTAINTDGDFEVIVRIDKPDNRLRIGMNSKLTIVLESRPSVFSVPYDAIVHNAAGQNVVYALGADGVTRTEIPVTVGMETDYFVEISGPDLKADLTILNDPEGRNVVTVSGPTGPFSGN